MPINRITGWKLTGHHGSPARRTDPTGNSKTSEIRTFFRQPVDVRRLHIRMPVTTQVSPSPVVSKDEQDIRLRCVLSLSGNGNYAEQGNGS